MTEPVTVPFEVQYHECDMQGVVFNAHYYTWADVASTALWRAVRGGYEQLMAEGLDTVVVASGCRYRSPARWQDRLEATVDVVRVGTTSFTAATTFRRHGELVAEVTVTYVFVARGGDRPIEPPPDLREALVRRVVVGEG